MPYVSKEQIADARSVDLLTYLQRFEPEELVHVGGSTYTTRSHDSLKISNGKWCWWSQGIGGTNALDYLVKVQGLSLPEAVLKITGNASISRSLPTPPRAAPAPFQLPPRHADNRRVFSYLNRRGIDPEIIQACIQNGQLYEDAVHHNCVFVGFRNGTPVYGALRGTLTQSTFVGDVPGSDKRFSFAYPIRASPHRTLCVFESAIDALSYLTLLKLHHQAWRSANTLSLAGIYAARKDSSMKCPAALEQYLADAPQIQKIVLCLDNDAPGRAASAAIQAALSRYEVVDNPPRRGKDYNDQLQILKGISGRVKTRGGEVR